MKTVHSIYVALGVCAAVLAAPARPAPVRAPDFSGYFVRVGDLWFDAVDDDKDGKPIDRLAVGGKDADDIYAGDFDNPILQPWTREIVKKIHDDSVTVIRRPDFLERLDRDGIEPVANTPEEFGAEIKTDLARWAKIVKAAGAKLE